MKESNMVLVLSEDAVRDCLDLRGMVETVEEALVKQARGAVERPERPHFPVGMGVDDGEALGTGIAMPAYIHGDDLYATKLVGVHEGNADRGLSTIHAQIVLTNVRTGVPEAFMGGTTITNARTGCIGALAVRELAPDASTLGVIGAGAQARWQTRAIATITELEDVRIYSPSDSRLACAADLSEQEIPARAVDSPCGAVEGADVVVTATTATEPVFPAEKLASDALVVAVGAYTDEMQELPPVVLERAQQVFADVPAEVAETGDVLAAELGEDDLVSFGAFLDDVGERDQTDPVVVLSVGSATLDAAAGTSIYQRAREQNSGVDISL
jgi:alanine dehydrogenase